MMSDALNELNLESGTKALFHEFLSGWFDGASHTLGGIVRTWPKARLVFDQTAHQQPMDDKDVSTAKVEIHLVSLNPGESSQHWDGAPGEKLSQARVPFHFWVKAKTAGGGAESKALAQDAAELLSGLLNNNGATYDLALKGIRALSARKAEPIRSEDWYVYQITARARLQWIVRP